jgi:hypothetical protein
MTQHIWPIIDEVRQTERATVVRLLMSLQTKAQVIRWDARTLEKLVMRKPAARFVLHARVRLGDEPYLSPESGDEVRDDVEHAGIRRRSNGVFDAGAHEGRVGPAPAGIGRDEHTSNVDAEFHDAFRWVVMARIVRDTVFKDH